MKTSTKKLYRKFLYETQDRQCRYCRVLLSSKNATLDHVQSKYDGGRDQLENLVVSCWWCNQAKSNLSIQDFMGFMRYMEENYRGFPSKKPSPSKLEQIFDEYEQSLLKTEDCDIPLDKVKSGNETSQSVPTGSEDSLSRLLGVLRLR